MTGEGGEEGTGSVLGLVLDSEEVNEWGKDLAAPQEITPAEEAALRKKMQPYERDISKPDLDSKDDSGDRYEPKDEWWKD